MNELRRPFFDEWTFVDCDRRCFPARETFRPGAEWWALKNTPAVSPLKDYRFRGMDAVKHAILDDFNARNGHELLHYRWLAPHAPERAPALFRTAYTQLSANQLQQLAQIVEATLADNDEQLAALFRSPSYYRAMVPNPN